MVTRALKDRNFIYNTVQKGSHDQYIDGHSMEWTNNDMDLVIRTTVSLQTSSSALELMQQHYSASVL